MRFIRPYLAYLALVGLGITALFAVVLGYYPIAIIGGSALTARSYWDYYDATVDARKSENSFFAAVYASSTLNSDTEKEKAPSEQEVQAMVLDALIEEKLVHNELVARFGSDLDALVASKMKRLDSDEKTKKIASYALGIPYDKIKDYIFQPIAEQDILTGRLYLGGQDFSSWVQTARKSAKVTILSSKFFWKDGSVSVK